MSILSIAIPVEAAVGAARPLIGLGIFAAVLVLFKPLIAGMLRAAMLVITPRKRLEESNARARFQGALMLNRMAREYETTQPGLAAELRSLASRG